MYLVEKYCCCGWTGCWWYSLLIDDDRRTFTRGLLDGWVSFFMQLALARRMSLSDWIDDFRMSRDSLDGASSLVGECWTGLQLLSTSACGGSCFFLWEPLRRSLRLDFREGHGDAAVTIMSILVSCCSSSPDCSMHVGRTFVDPVGESFMLLMSLRLAGALPFGRSRKILSSSAFNDPNTDGGVKWIRGGSCGIENCTKSCHTI